MTQRGDLVSELRQQARNRTENIGPDAHVATAEWRAATAIEAKDAEIARLNKRLDLLAVGFSVPDGGKYIADWQTRIKKFQAAESRIAELERQLAEGGVMPSEEIIAAAAEFLSSGERSPQCGASPSMGSMQEERRPRCESHHYLRSGPAMTHQDVAGVIAELLKLIAVCEKAASDERRVLLDPAAVLPIAKSAHSSLESQAEALSEATEAVFIEHDSAVAWQANARSLESSLAEARRVIEQCRDALSRCYDVVDWPADGSTPQDEALTDARDFITKEKT